MIDEEPDPPVRRYADLLRELIELRKRNGDQDCSEEEEDALLEKLHDAWRALTAEQCERAEQILSVELSQCEGS